MRTKVAAIFFILLFEASCLTAEEVKFEEIKEPHVVTIDRRPSPNIVYTRCFGIFGSGKEEFFTAIKATDKRKCPAPESQSANVEKSGDGEKIVTDGGETVAETVQLARNIHRRKETYKGKEYQLVFSPNKITIMKPGKPGEPMQKVDSFYIFVAPEVGNLDNQLVVACNDGSSLRACLDSKLDAKKLQPDEVEKFTAHAETPNLNQSLASKTPEHVNSNDAVRPLRQDKLLN